MVETPTPRSGSSLLSRTINRSIVLSILMIIAGILAVFMPTLAGIAVNVLAGWLLIFSGAAHIVYAWSARHHFGGLLLGILLGLVFMLVGFYLLLNPLVGLASLTLALALYLFAEAIIEFILSIRLRPLPNSGWFFVDSLFCVALAIMIALTWPSNSDWVLGTFVGLGILFSGITRLTLAMSARQRLTTRPTF